jgi:protein-tyrosine phosphatase
VLEQLGGDVSDFAARQLTAKIASNADLILTMTKAHRDAVLELAPRQLKRTFTLSEAAQIASEFNPPDIATLAALRPRIAGVETSDIPDPIGQSSMIFEEVGARIANHLSPVLETCRRA